MTDGPPPLGGWTGGPGDATPPTVGGPAPGEPRTAGTAIAALVLGILSIVLPIVGWFLAIAALVFGTVTLRQIGRTPGLRGRGMSITGIVLGLIGGLLLPMLLLGLVARSSLRQIDKADAAACTLELRVLRTANEAYLLDNGTAPSGPQDLVDAGLLREMPEHYSFVLVPDTAGNPAIEYRSTDAQCPHP